MSISKLQSKYPFISWLEYLNGLMKPFAKVTCKDRVTVKSPCSLENLAKLLDETPNRVVANYAYWRVVAESAEYLSEQVQQKKREFDSVLYGKKKKIHRWQYCVDHVNNKLHLATGSLYIRKFFNKKSKDSVMNMVSELKNSLEQLLKQVKNTDLFIEIHIN